MNSENLIKTTKLFKECEINLKPQEIDDLRHRLTTKPYHLYKMVIMFLHSRNYRISYENVSNLIRLEIRIRNEVRKFITSFEEAIWNIYINHLEKQGQVIDLKQISKKTTFASVIEALDVPEFHTIRQIRNDVSHLVYFIIFEKMQWLLDSLNKIRGLSFVKSTGIDLLLRRIETHEQELGFYKNKLY